MADWFVRGELRDTAHEAAKEVREIVRHDLSGAVQAAGHEAAKEIRETVRHDIAPAIKQIIDHAKQTPVGVSLAGIPVSGTLKEAGLAAAEKLKEIVVFELAKAINQMIDHTRQAPVGIELGGAQGKPLAATIGGAKDAPIHMDWALGGGKSPLQLAPLTIRLDRTTVTSGLAVKIKLFGLIPLLTLNLDGKATLG